MELAFKPLVWLAIGFGLMALEILAPGFVVFWFGIGGMVTALLVWIGVLPTAEWQWLVFFVSSSAFLSFWHFYLKKFFKKEVVDEVRDPTLLNLKGTAAKRIEKDRPGEVELFQPFHGIRRWKASSEETILEGEEIQVLEAEGVHLKVEKLKNKQQGESQ